MGTVFQRHRSIFFLVILSLIPQAAFSDQAPPASVTSQSARSTLLVVGDSLSAAYGLKQHEGWVTLLQNIWQQENTPVQVVNAAISGETSDGALARLPRLLEQHAPSHVFIEIGGNDGLQGHPTAKMRNNIAEMIDLARAAGAKVILQDVQIPPNYGKRYTEMFTNTFDALAKEKNVPLVPFFIEDIALDSSMMQRDGIHPNAEAQPGIAKFMHEQLTPLVTESADTAEAE